MNRLKRYFILLIAATLTLTLFGCGLIGADTSVPATNGSLDQDLPEWLTVAHRAQMEERPVEEPESNGLDQDSEGTPLVNQPASPQPGTTPPPQQGEQPAPTSGTPRWQQPGTMEYVAKLRLDQLVFNYRNLDRGINDYDEDNPYQNKTLKDLKKDRKDLYELMTDLANSIGLSLRNVYGISAPPADPSTTKDSSWFYDPDHSPSGFEHIN